MIQQGLRKICQVLVIVLFSASLGGCAEYIVYGLVEEGLLSSEEADKVIEALYKEEGQAGTRYADFNEMTNAIAHKDIYRDPHNYLTYSNPGFNADKMTKPTYPGIFCGTGNGVSSSLKGFAFSVADIASLKSQFQSLGIANPSLAQVTSVCALGAGP